MSSGIYNPYDRLSGPAFDNAEPELSAPRMDMGVLDSNIRQHPDPSYVRGWRLARGEWTDWFVIDQPSWDYWSAHAASMSFAFFPNNDSALQKAFGAAFKSSGGNFDACIAAVGQNPVDSGLINDSRRYPQLVYPFPSGPNQQPELRNSGPYQGSDTLQNAWIPLSFTFVGSAPAGVAHPSLMSIPIVKSIGFLK